MNLKWKLIILIFLFLLVVFSFQKKSSCFRLSCINMNGLDKYELKEIYKEENDSFRALYKNEEKMLRVEKMSQPDQFNADQFITADISRLKGLFTDSLAPYPGIASNTISCGKDYQPTYNKFTTKNKLEVSSYTAYLNSNLTYGSCTKDQTTYKGVTAYFYCPSNKLVYHLELISPIKVFESSPEEFQKMIESVKCK